jgi:hypothetical protein
MYLENKSSRENQNNVFSERQTFKVLNFNKYLAKRPDIRIIEPNFGRRQTTTNYFYIKCSFDLQKYLIKKVYLIDS